MMEACTDAPAGKRRHRIRQIASCCVFWIGTALIGVIAIPAGLLFGMIYLIVWAANCLIDWLERD